jgi:hypothetical protein
VFFQYTETMTAAVVINRWRGYIGGTAILFVRLAKEWRFTNQD